MSIDLWKNVWHVPVWNEPEYCKLKSGWLVVTVVCSSDLKCTPVVNTVILCKEHKLCDMNILTVSQRHHLLWGLVSDTTFHMVRWSDDTRAGQYCTLLVSSDHQMSLESKYHWPSTLRMKSVCCSQAMYMWIIRCMFREMIHFDTFTTKWNATCGQCISR